MYNLRDEIWLHRAAMLRLAGSILRHPQNAEDAVSRAMLLAVQKLGTLHDPSALKPWLMQITARCAYDIQRREKRERLRMPLAENTCTLFECAEESLYAQLQRLPKALAQVLVLYYYEGYDTGDIARTLCIPAATVRMRLSRGRKRLKAIVEEEEA